MKIYLSGRNDALLEAWTLFCGQYDFVTVYKQDILFIETDAPPKNIYEVQLHMKQHIATTDWFKVQAM